MDAGAKEHGFPYESVIHALNNSNINLNRKILANLAQFEPYSFKAVLDELHTQRGMKRLEHIEDEMSFNDAIDRKYLVFDDVPPQQELRHDEIPVIFYPE